MIEKRVADLLAQLSASEQRMDDWRSRFARAYEVDKDEAIGGIYDRCMALEIEVRQHLRNEIDQAFREMFDSSWASPDTLISREALAAAMVDDVDSLFPDGMFGSQ